MARSRGGGRGRGWARSGSARPSRRSLDPLWSSRQQLSPASRRRTPRAPRGRPRGRTAAATSLGRHVVEQEPRRAGRERLVDLGGVAHLDRERQVGPGRAGAPHGRADAAGERGVVLLDQDEVVEPGAVVGAAAVGDGALLERAQARASSCACRAASRSRRPLASRARRARSAWRRRTAGRGSSARCARRSAARAPSPRRAAPAPAARATRPRARAARPRVGIEPEEHRLGDVEPRRSRPGAFCVIVATPRAAASTVASAVTSPAPTSSASAASTRSVMVTPTNIAGQASVSAARRWCGTPGRSRRAGARRSP